MTHEQLPDGRWVRKDVPPKFQPQEVRCWYMRDNHTFRALPLDVDAALAAMREERDAGSTYGMLCGRPDGVVPPVVHARNAAEWPAFEAKARPWLDAAVAASKPPNVQVKRPPTAWRAVGARLERGVRLVLCSELLAYRNPALDVLKGRQSLQVVVGLHYQP